MKFKALPPSYTHSTPLLGYLHISFPRIGGGSAERSEAIGALVAR